ncbi:MAG: AAA family ATPase [Roseiflexaceae bacterium]|nr:AAA family ATPase [Roseiflexaceae bacterium]
MSTTQRVAIPLLPTGVPGFDVVLGGGLPEFSFNLISGTPGAGKTTLAHQIMFANASPVRPALYFTVMGEPPIKMLRYQQQLSFFDLAKVGTSVRFIDLSGLLLEQDLSAVLARILEQVKAFGPGIVIVDSFQAIARAMSVGETEQPDLRSFTQRLAAYLTSWQATTFLIGEYYDRELHTNPVLTIADGVFQLSQQADRNSVVRKLQVVKSRGQAVMPGLHTFRMNQAGIQVYPRMSIVTAEGERLRPSGRGATGVAGLDALVGGGIPYGDAVLVSGPSGAGKSVLAAQFVAAGVAQGEPGVIAVFEEHPQEYMRRAHSLGVDLAALERQGSVKMIYIRPLDLSPDETLTAIREAVQQIGAKRVVIDSISGFEMALAPTFRTDFRESLYRLVGSLTGTGIIVLMTMEITQNTVDLRFSPYVISFLTDDIILLRYIEIAGQLRKSMVVVKMRNSAHNANVHMYDITDQGLIIRESLQEYRSGNADAASLPTGVMLPLHPGLTDSEVIVLRALIEQQQASVPELLQRTGIAEQAHVAAALDRLTSLGYAAALPGDTNLRYQPIVQRR